MIRTSSHTTDYESLAACIRSGQISQEHVPTLFGADPSFAAWYKAKYMRKSVVERCKEQHLSRKGIIASILFVLWGSISV